MFAEDCGDRFQRFGVPDTGVDHDVTEQRQERLRVCLPLALDQAQVLKAGSDQQALPAGLAERFGEVLHRQRGELVERPDDRRPVVVAVGLVGAVLLVHRLTDLREQPGDERGNEALLGP